MEVLGYLKIVGGAAVVSLVLAVMTSFSPRRRLWLSEEAYQRRRTLSHVLITWVIGWMLLSAGGIYLVHYISSFGT